jgi:hypothetical protein
MHVSSPVRLQTLMPHLLIHYSFFCLKLYVCILISNVHFVLLTANFTECLKKKKIYIYIPPLHSVKLAVNNLNLCLFIIYYILTKASGYLACESAEVSG